jgi:RimJ/RimL family protein N-acetyltransferase
LVLARPHETIDLDPASRRDDVGEIYHIVIDRKFAEHGLGTATIGLAIAALRDAMSKLRAVRVAQHPKNIPAAKLYAKLGFAFAGEKIDGETGIKDVLLELALTSPLRAS